MASSSDAATALRTRRLVTAHSQRYLISAGNWPEFVSDVKDSLADQPDKCREFVDFLVDFHYRRIGVIVKTLKVLLDGHPELIYRLNQFLPSNHQIKIKMEIKVKEEPQP